MNRTLIAGLVGFGLIFTLVALFVFTGEDKEVKTEPDRPELAELELRPGDGLAEVAVSEVGGFTVTNPTAKSYEYLEFKIEGKGTGTVSVRRCEVELAPDLTCSKPGPVVLPDVDVAGWKYWLAGGATSLAPDETAYYYVEGDKNDNLTLQVRPKGSGK